MSRLGEMLPRHRNTFLIALLTVTLILSRSAATNGSSPTVEIPVIEAAAAAISGIESFRQQRDQEETADMTVLENLVNLEQLDAQTREEAAGRLQTIIYARQLQRAVEGLLVGSSLYPCAAVLQSGVLSIVTEKTMITERDTALVLTLAADLGGIQPENVRIICCK